jgi:hypothetical protein
MFSPRIIDYSVQIFIKLILFTLQKATILELNEGDKIIVEKIAFFLTASFYLGLLKTATHYLNVIDRKAKHGHISICGLLGAILFGLITIYVAIVFALWILLPK